MGLRGRLRRPGVPGPGRGSRLDPDSARYFRRALETLREGLSPEELALFTPNVLAEALAAAPGVSLDPGGSQLLQGLLPRAPLSFLAQLLPLLVVGGLEGPAGHPWGSRVLEVALGRVGEALGEPPGQEEGAVGQVEGAVGQLVAQVLGDLVGFAQHPTGSFVLRALLRVLGGEPGAEPPKGAGPKRKGAELPRKGAGLPGKGAGLPPSFPPLLGQLAEAFEEHLPSLLAPPCASLCLQGALRALGRSQSERCARLCHALIGRLAPPGPAHDQSPALARGLRDPRLGRALEAALGALDPPALRGLFREGLRGHLRGVASHPLANHGLQRLLDHAPEDVVGEVLQELGPSLGEPLARGCPGVLVALAGAARRSPALQPEALRCLLQAFGCWAPPERRRGCVGALGRLRPLAEGEGPEAPLGPVTLQGSLLLQHLLHFQDPGVVLGGLGALSPPALLALACSPPGSHVWDALLSSPHVPPRAPRRLLRRLQGLLLPLACHPNGSRVLDALWAWSPLPARLAMAAELAPQLQALQRDPHGRGVARTLLLELFLRRRSQWEQLQGTPQNAWDPQKPPGGLSGPLEN